MRKIVGLIFTFVLAFAIVGCEESKTDVTVSTYEIAMILDIGTIEDNSFNQGIWEGIVDYASKNKITHKYYKTAKQSTDDYLAAIKIAVDDGAKIVVTPGFLFEEAITLAQNLYPKVNFILIDGHPTTTNNNTLGIKFSEEQAGYLAGYSAVIEGYTKLGFLGGIEVPAVVRYGYGFAQGAQAAAAELGIENIDLKYHYAGGFEATPNAQALAAFWYADDTEIIFVCAGTIGNSTMTAAQLANKKVIGVDVDQSSQSATVITSAMKSLAFSVQNALALYYAGNFPGGKSLIYDASSNGIGLAMDTSTFKIFTQDNYDRVFGKLAAGEITIQNDKDVNTPNQLPLSLVNIIFIE
ncbi:MAG: BMP family ABC transporter substrate-binding protein [Arcobacteraceae bacterium]